MAIAYDKNKEQPEQANSLILYQSSSSGKLSLRIVGPDGGALCTLFNFYSDGKLCLSSGVTPEYAKLCGFLESALDDDCKLKVLP